LKAVILSAGQGKRLLPLTEHKPKCLVEINGKTILEWQLKNLLKAGVRSFTIVTGFKSILIENLILNKYKDFDIDCIYNPFYTVSDNLASCWLAREKFYDDFLIVNGDDLFEVALINKLIKSRNAPITVAVNIKETYDQEDMKVLYNRENGRLLRVGKDIECNKANGEAIGIHLFRNRGVSFFRRKVEDLMREEAALKMWYLSAINSLVNETEILVCDITGYRWSEIDFIQDLQKANDIVKGFSDDK
jgi:choline kinase